MSIEKTIILLKARYNWIHLHLQDFKIVNDYSCLKLALNWKLKLYSENITNEDILEEDMFYFSCLECASASTISRA